MRKKILQFIQYVMLISIVAFVLLLFMPRTYEVPQMHQLKDTQYWVLKTGSKIAYTLLKAKGIKKSTPIIFLQGGPGGFISDKNIKTLAPLSEDGYDVYLYDQIGSGHSDRLVNINEYTAIRHKNDLEEIIKRIGTEKVIFIGQSWGAILATLFIADNPNKVEKVIITGAGPIQPWHDALLNITAPDSLNLRKPISSNKAANKNFNNIRMDAVRFFAKSFGIKIATDKEADNYQTYLNNELNKATVCDTSKAWKAEGGGGFYAQLMTVKSFNKIQDPRQKLKGLYFPILIMRGQCDNQPWGVVHEYLELFPNYQLKIIQKAGHSIAVEQPELYLKTIREFLKNSL